MAISQTQITSTNTISIYSSTLNSAVTAIYICNTSVGTLHFTLQVVPPTDEPSENRHAIYYSIPLTSSDTYVIDTERLILGDGDSIFISVPDLDYLLGDQIIATVSYIGI
jgi:hypothetical protein